MSPPSAIDVEVKGVTDTEGIALPNPLTVNDVPGRRAKSQKFSMGVAAHASSDMFKSASVSIPGKAGVMSTILI
jgi:aromatic amino acid aminotransferase I / 2-aminoadipate transaminase